MDTRMQNPLGQGQEERSHEGTGVEEALPGTNTPVCNPTTRPGEELEEEVADTLGDQPTSGVEPTDSSGNLGSVVEPSLQAFDKREESDQEGEAMEEEESSGSSVSSEECTLSENTPTEYSNTIDEPDWGEAYKLCPRFGEVWTHVNNPQLPWPPGYQREGGRLFCDGVLCIPTRYEKLWVLDQHSFLGHVGVDRLWGYIKFRFQWADMDRVRRLLRHLLRVCQVCQACQRSTSLKARLRSLPVPAKIMSSVAIDLFSLPEVTSEGAKFNTMVVCVDRHSGWTVAVPVQGTGPQGKGITGAQIAKLMLRHQWRPFGIPSTITSDRGAHFIGSWWQTLCAELGIRAAYAQAYHHQANGRAERAGQEIMERARKLHNEHKISWVEALPQILDRIHDTPGDMGLSPYEILFGRPRPLAGRPYTPPTVAEDAKAFVERMQDIDTKVAEFVNWRNERDIERLNKGRKPFPRLVMGQRVWVQRPEGSGTKLDTRWIGPAKVVEQKGSNSYKVQLDEERFLDVPAKYLKLYEEDPWVGQKTPLFWHKRTEVEEEAEPTEGTVEKVLGHRVVGGRTQFLVRWGENGEESWAEVEDFLRGVNEEWWKYCREKGVGLDLRDVRLERL